MLSAISQIVRAFPHTLKLHFHRLMVEVYCSVRLAEWLCIYFGPLSSSLDYMWAFC
jgi:hypothetical protein